MISAPPHLRIAVHALAPGTMIAERDIRGVVAGVWVEEGMEPGVRNVLLEDGRLLLWHEFRRVGIHAGTPEKSTPCASRLAAISQ